MPAESFGAGDQCQLQLKIVNEGPARVVDLYILLDVFGAYWSYPSWVPLNDGLDYATTTVEAGLDAEWEIIPAFIMPAVSPAGPLYFYAAMFAVGELDLDHLVSNGAVYTFYLE